MIRSLYWYYRYSLSCILGNITLSLTNLSSFALRQLLGINIFTYILAAAIAFFFSMNIILGPGWLGNSIGLEGTGSFQKVSDALPEIIDLSSSDYLL